jgi:hypothetical protein
MLISILVLLPVVGIFAFLGRGCSFSPGGPTVDPSAVPSVQVAPVLATVARQVPIPLRNPATPTGWRATSVDPRPAPGGAVAVRVSWLTSAGRYLRLVQSNAEEGALVADETAGQPGAAAPVRVGATDWVAYRGANGEQAWAHRDGPVEWLVTGDGVAAEFQALAQAVAAAPPLPGPR